MNAAICLTSASRTRLACSSVSFKSSRTALRLSNSSGGGPWRCRAEQPEHFSPARDGAAARLNRIATHGIVVTGRIFNLLDENQHVRLSFLAPAAHLVSSSAPL